MACFYQQVHNKKILYNMHERPFQIFYSTDIFHERKAEKRVI